MGIFHNVITTTPTQDALDIVDSNYMFDFGTNNSPLFGNYIRISNLTAYSSALGYGWVSTNSLDSRDRGAPDDLRRDFVFSSNPNTFNIDLYNGKYFITTVIGDNDYGHDSISIYYGNTIVADNISQVAGSFTESTYSVNVLTGQIRLKIIDNGGVDSNWVLNAISVLKITTESMHDITGILPIIINALDIT